MTTRALLLLALVVAGCAERVPRWRDEPVVPAGAAARLASCLSIGERSGGIEAASDQLRYMVAWVWYGRADGTGMRFTMRDGAERARATVCDEPAPRRLARLRVEAFGEGLAYLGIVAEDLAFRRFALDRPELLPSLREAGADLHDGSPAHGLDREGVERRAAAVEAELEALRRRYERGLEPYLRCVERLDTRVEEIQQHLVNARGDFGTTTGGLHEMLGRAGVVSRGLTPFDQGIIVERHCRGGPEAP